MALSVIGSGFGRTGTRSLKDALDQLGFGPCHHMEEVFPNPRQVDYWCAVARNEPVDWDDVFAGYGAQIDWPGAHVWRELAAAYPDARVIHSVRPAEAWWSSFSGTIGKFLAIYRDLPMPPHVAAMGAAVDTIGRLCPARGRCPRGDPARAVAGVRRGARVGTALCVPRRRRARHAVSAHQQSRRFLGEARRRAGLRPACRRAVPDQPARLPPRIASTLHAPGPAAAM
jgi:hypothetical protein